MSQRQFFRLLYDDYAEDRVFGLLFCAIFFLGGGIPLVFGGSLHNWSLIVSGIFFAVSILRPSFLATPRSIWMKFGVLLHRVISPVVLAGLFFLIVTPYALIMRVFRRDVLLLSREPQSNSYWIFRKSDELGKGQMTNQF